MEAPSLPSRYCRIQLGHWTCFFLERSLLFTIVFQTPLKFPFCLKSLSGISKLFIYPTLSPSLWHNLFTPTNILDCESTEGKKNKYLLYPCMIMQMHSNYWIHICEMKFLKSHYNGGEKSIIQQICLTCCLNSPFFVCQKLSSLKKLKSFICFQSIHIFFIHFKG